MSAALVQLCIAIFGLSALAMALGNHSRARRWAPVVGLLGQPFWFWFAWSTRGWGLMALVAAYTAVYLAGARAQWRAAT
jgi:hypothetical protein